MMNQQLGEAMNDVVQHVVGSEVQGVSITEAAKTHFIQGLNKETTPYVGVRLSLKKTGCSGLSYVVEYSVSPVEGDISIEMNAKYSLFIDKAGYPFLKGTEIDFVKQGLNHKLVFNNPNQTGLCGCGESFTIEE